MTAAWCAETVEAELSGVLGNIFSSVADCRAQSRALEERKAALLVELGTVSAALDDVYQCRTQLEGMQESMLDELYERLGESTAAEVERQLENISSKPQLQPQQSSALQQPSQSPPKQQQQEQAKAPRKERTPRKPSGQQAHEDRKQARLAAALPIHDAEREELLQRQVVVRGLKPGSVDALSLSSLLQTAFCALPCFDPAAGLACSADGVQLYGGGSYAFVAMRDVALAATALLLPPLCVDGASLTLHRVRGHEKTGAAEALPVPHGLDLTLVLAGSAAKEQSLETKLYWSLRNWRVNPRPNEKEVKEALAFFKRSEKVCRACGEEWGAAAREGSFSVWVQAALRAACC